MFSRFLLIVEVGQKPLLLSTAWIIVATNYLTIVLAVAAAVVVSASLHQCNLLINSSKIATQTCYYLCVLGSISLRLSSHASCLYKRSSELVPPHLTPMTTPPPLCRVGGAPNINKPVRINIYHSNPDFLLP